MNARIRQRLTGALSRLPGRLGRFADSARGGAAAAAVPVATTARGPEALDERIAELIAQHGIPGAALAVVRRGRLVHARGFRYANVELAQHATPTTLFRIASISKPITATAIMRLVRRGGLSLDAPLDDLLELKPPKGIDLDPRWRQVTVRQLLHHTGGWDQARSGDPMHMALSVRRDLSLTGDITPDDVIRWMMYRPLDFEPGSRYAYSCFGYTVLGRVIERVTGEAYEDVVRREVFEPLGLVRPVLGRSLAGDAAPDEATYYALDDARGPAVVGPNVGELVPLPYGTWPMEAMASRGGWLFSAVDLARFGAAFQEPEKYGLVSRDEIDAMWSPPPGPSARHEDGTIRGTYYGLGWSVRRLNEDGDRNTWHTGLYSGVAGLLVLRHDGVGWVLLMNARHSKSTRQELTVPLEPLLYEIMEQITLWPDEDLFPRYAG